MLDHNLEQPAAREDGGTPRYTITTTAMQAHCIVYEDPPGICHPC